MKFLSNSVTDTERIAAELASSLVGGECIAVDGDVGAGKTQFVRGLVRGLGGDERIVNSPTFTLLNIYDTPRMKVFHLDAYRVGGADDFDSIGFPELLEQGGLVCLEWPSRISSILPEKLIRVEIEATGERSRVIQILRPNI